MIFKEILIHLYIKNMNIEKLMIIYMGHNIDLLRFKIIKKNNCLGFIKA